MVFDRVFKGRQSGNVCVCYGYMEGYVDEVSGKYHKAYDEETRERGKEVDLQCENIPLFFDLDRKIIYKTDEHGKRWVIYFIDRFGGFYSERHKENIYLMWVSLPPF